MPQLVMKKPPLVNASTSAVSDTRTCRPLSSNISSGTATSDRIHGSTKPSTACPTTGIIDVLASAMALSEAASDIFS